MLILMRGGIMDQPLSIQIVSKKIDGQYEAAVISGGKFARALSGKDLFKIVSSQLSALLSLERNEGTEVNVTVTISDGPSEEKTDGAQ